MPKKPKRPGWPAGRARLYARKPDGERSEVRVQFRLRPDEVERLHELAERFTQGNLTELFRQAIEQYAANGS